MKKIIAIILALLLIGATLIIVLTSCEDTEEHIINTFEDNSDKSPQEIAQILTEDEQFPFDCFIEDVFEGLLKGFDRQIAGFVNAVVLQSEDPINPFISYIFELDGDTDVDKFVDEVTHAAQKDWNPYGEADEVIVETDGDKVIVIITPEDFVPPTQPTEEEMVVHGDEFDVSADDFDVLD